jgi:hypothetical protein
MKRNSTKYMRSVMLMCLMVCVCTSFRFVNDANRSTFMCTILPMFLIAGNVLFPENRTFMFPPCAAEMLPSRIIINVYFSVDYFCDTSRAKASAVYVQTTNKQQIKQPTRDMRTHTHSASRAVSGDLRESCDTVTA